MPHLLSERTLPFVDNVVAIVGIGGKGRLLDEDDFTAVSLLLDFRNLSSKSETADSSGDKFGLDCGKVLCLEGGSLFPSCRLDCS